MRIETAPLAGGIRYLLYKERDCIGQAELWDVRLTVFEVCPAWRRRGYGSYFLREILRRNRGFDPQAETCFTAPLPQEPGVLAFAARFGFVPDSGCLCRRHVPSFTAVGLVHRELAMLLKPGGFYLDATCGNGHDTLFLCGLAGMQGRVLGLDIQPRAAAATNALLRSHGFSAIGKAVCADHRRLAEYVPAGTADCVLFNFGWLPGAPHEVYSSAESTLPALRAGLAALKPGGVLAAVLYSGKVIGHAEKDAVLEFFHSLPLREYTVLSCCFCNWADTAPLPCFVFKNAVCPP
jgi:hypothetical protein